MIRSASRDASCSSSVLVVDASLIPRYNNHAQVHTQQTTPLVSERHKPVYSPRPTPDTHVRAYRLHAPNSQPHTCVVPRTLSSPTTTQLSSPAALARRRIQPPTSAPAAPAAAVLGGRTHCSPLTRGVGRMPGRQPLTSWFAEERPVPSPPPGAPVPPRATKWTMTGHGRAS